MVKEKRIEKEIVDYLKTTGGLVESMQGGSVMVKKPGYNHRMTLNSKGCPDILFYFKGQLYGFEIKKNQKEVKKWHDLQHRYNGIGKSLEGLKSYDREIGQFRYRDQLINNGGLYLCTCSLEKIKEYLQLNQK